MKTHDGAPALIVRFLLLATCAGPAGAQAALTFVAVSAGSSHTCALTKDGIAYCWGLNDVGQLGSDSAMERCDLHSDEQYLCSSTPLRVKGAHRYTSITVGTRVSCGLVPSGAVHCWGDRAFMPPGDTAVTTWTTPVMVVDTPAFLSFALGQYVLCGIGSGGAVYCAGRNGDGVLGRGEATPDFDEVRKLGPVSGGLAITAVGVGDNGFACGLAREGRVYCWGLDGGWGVLGRRGAQSSSPLLIAGAPQFQALSVGGYYVCGLTPAGVALCWGGGDMGQLGNGRAAGSAEPVRVDGSARFASISTGYMHACAVSADGVAYCWGSNLTGELGTSDTRETCADGSCSRRPRPVAGDQRFAAVSAGFDHTCGVTTDGTVYCWGSNDAGQLGVRRGTGHCGLGRSAVPCSPTPVRVIEPRQ
jgi:alpha-tubulin suppressor-like RCC1 family protein